MSGCTQLELQQAGVSGPQRSPQAPAAREGSAHATDQSCTGALMQQSADSDAADPASYLPQCAASLSTSLQPWLQHMGHT